MSAFESVVFSAGRTWITKWKKLFPVKSTAKQETKRSTEFLPERKSFDFKYGASEFSDNIKNSDGIKKSVPEI